MCAVLLLPDNCLELAQRKSEESELGNEKGKIPVNSTYEGGCKDALSTEAGGGKGNRKLLSSVLITGSNILTHAVLRVFRHR